MERAPSLGEPCDPGLSFLLDIVRAEHSKDAALTDAIRDHLSALTAAWAQPVNFAVITLDEDPGINFLSNLPGTPAGEVPAGAPVELIFEKTSNGQMIPEWEVTRG